MIKKILHIFLLFAFPLVGVAQKDLVLIKERILSELYSKNNEMQITKAVLAYKNMNADGSWTGILYESKDASKWQPIAHLERLQQLALAYSNPKSIYKGDADLYDKLTKGLAFWYLKNPTSSNWWHNDIATPQYLGRILLLTGSTNRPLPTDVQQAILSRMQSTQSPFSFTGANKLDIAIHYIYRALITDNEKLMNMAVLEAFQPIEFTTGEGLQYDYSYFQHKEQLMISSYGLVFLSGGYNVAAWLTGTKYALNPEKHKLLNQFFFNTFAHALRGGYTDYNTEGRGISRPNGLNRRSLADEAGESGLLVNVSRVNPDKTEEIEAIRKRVSGQEAASYKLKPVHYYYWRGDYTQHVRPGYSFNVRTVSTRSVRTESGNNENLLGTVLPDASMNLVRRGDEYFNIMPAWEWDKIPGVTARDYDTAVTMKKNWGIYGSTDFVGGLSDSLFGITVYTQNYDDVAAKKSYFFFDKEIVCLGSGIRSKAPQPITTTVNQCWNRGKVVTNTKEGTNLLKKPGTFSNINWVWHDSVAYIFKENTEVSVSTNVQSGNWTTINKNNKGEVKGSVFKTWIHHGLAPQAKTYAYIVVPGISEKEMNQFDHSSIHIISNTEKLQAVEHKNLGIVQATFFEPGLLKTDDITIETDQACVLQLAYTDKKEVKLSIADPTQKLSQLQVEISVGTITQRKLKVRLPEGHYTGSTTTLTLK